LSLRRAGRVEKGKKRAPDIDGTMEIAPVLVFRIGLFHDKDFDDGMSFPDAAAPALNERIGIFVVRFVP